MFLADTTEWWLHIQLTDVLHIVLTFESRPNVPVTRPFSTFRNVIICHFWEAGLVEVFGGTCFNTQYCLPVGESVKTHRLVVYKAENSFTDSEVRKLMKLVLYADAIRMFRHGNNFMASWFCASCPVIARCS